MVADGDNYNENADDSWSLIDPNQSVSIDYNKNSHWLMSLKSMFRKSWKVWHKLEL